MALDKYYAGSSHELLDTEDGEVHPVPGSVPVTIKDVLDVRDMAARTSGMRSYNLGTTTPVKVAGHDPRRRFLKLNGVDFTNTSHGVRLGNSANEALGPNAFLLPVFSVGGLTATTVPLEISAISELWAVADTAAITVSVLTESWI